MRQKHTTEVFIPECILEAVFFIRDAVRKSKAAAAAETEAAAKNPAEF